MEGTGRKGLEEDHYTSWVIFKLILILVEVSREPGLASHLLFIWRTFCLVYRSSVIRENSSPKEDMKEEYEKGRKIFELYRTEEPSSGGSGYGDTCWCLSKFKLVFATSLWRRIFSLVSDESESHG